MRGAADSFVAFGSSLAADALAVRRPVEADQMSQRVFPQLRMTNWQRSRVFYADGLGFTIDWEHRFEPGFPVFAQLTLKGLSLFLSEHSGDCQVGGAAYFVIDDVDMFCRTIRGRGIEPAGRPSNTPWGTREVVIVDPDGNRLRFANPVPAGRTLFGNDDA